MSRRSLVAALTLVLAIGVVAPTLAQRSAQPPSLLAKGFAKKTAKKAKRIAKEARSLAKAADRRAASAQRSAGEAGDAAQAASAQAAAVEQQLAGQKAVTATAAATVSTSEDSEFVDLGGPKVTVNVPQSGLIEVWAQATIGPEGAVSVYEDGEQMDGQDANGACAGPGGALIAHEAGDTLTLSTPTGFPLLLCGNDGPPAPVLLSTSPGNHTYELRYADCGCDSEPADFSDRTLTVAPRP